MSNQKMTAVLLHLGTNMWGKQGQKPFCLSEELDSTDKYYDTLLTDRATWKEIVDFLPTVGINTVLIDMGEGVEMKRHPEIAVKGTWSQKEFRQELDRMRSRGLTVLPKFNFSCGHNAWMKDMAYQVGTPQYDAFCKDIVEETIELFDHPALFHLGLEEEDAAAQCHQPIIICRSPEKRARDANFLFDLCRAGGARPWIWIDPRSMANDWGGQESFLAAVPKDVLLSNWYYGYEIRVGEGEDRIKENPRTKLYFDLEEWGYDQVPTGSALWGYYNNPRLTAHLVHDHLDPAHVSGMMVASWLPVTPRMKLGIEFDAQCLGEAVRTYPFR